jgi:flagellar biosynthesis anti-sigma factor FlgM
MDVRITGGPLKSIENTYKTIDKTSKPEQTKAPVEVAKDSVDLSPEARAIMDLVKNAEIKARDLPDVREKLVSELRAKVQDGQYHVDARAVSEQMLAELKNVKPRGE